MATKRLTYIGHAADGVEVDEPGWYGHFPQGDPVEVPDAIAGRPPSGTPGEEGYDPGEGLLAQATFVEAGSSGPTVADILGQVGDDPVKAAAALSAEQGRGHARKTLVAELEAIVAAATETQGATNG